MNLSNLRHITFFFLFRYHILNWIQLMLILIHIMTFCIINYFRLVNLIINNGISSLILILIGIKWMLFIDINLAFKSPPCFCSFLSNCLVLEFICFLIFIFFSYWMLIVIEEIVVYSIELILNSRPLYSLNLWLIFQIVIILIVIVLDDFCSFDRRYRLWYLFIDLLKEVRHVLQRHIRT